MKKLKSGFSLIELAVIVVIVGVMFAAGASVLKGRGSALEINKTADRLEQANNLVMGYAVVNRNLPNRNSTTSSDNLTDFFALGDSYGNDFKYIPADNLIHATGNDLCDITDSNLSLILDENGARRTLATNVAYVIASRGADLTSRIALNVARNEVVVTKGTNTPLDDPYKYTTLNILKTNSKCAGLTPIDSEIHILTETLPVYENITFKFDNGTRKTVGHLRPGSGGPIVVANKSNTRWCADSPQNTNLTKSINILPVDSNFNRVPSTTALTIHEKRLGGPTIGSNCALFGSPPPNYSSSYYGVQVVLAENVDDIVAGTYDLVIFAMDPNKPNIQNLASKTYKIKISTDSMTEVTTP